METILKSSLVQFAALKTDKASLRRIFLECRSLTTYQVDIYLLHGLDIATPIEETLKAVNILHKARRFSKVVFHNVAYPFLVHQLTNST